MLFSDISGFTALTEKLQERGREGAEEIAAIVSSALDPALAAIETWGGSVVSFGGTSYFAIRELLRQAVGLPDLAQPDAVIERVDAETTRLGLSATDRHHLAEVLGARYEPSPLVHLDGKAIRLNNMVAIRNYLLHRARKRPQLFVLEDMQWADEATREAADWLGKAIAAENSGAGALLLLLYRPGYEPPPAAQPIQLQELTPQQVEAMLTGFLTEVPESVGRMVMHRAGGNPFYVEELVRHLLESGILAPTNEGYSLVREPGLDDLPRNLELLVAARLDQMSGQTRLVAQLAAVIGVSFHLTVLEHLDEVGAFAGKAVKELEAREIVLLRKQNPHPQYIFKQAITRDVAYGTILAARRRELHRAVAKAVEEVFQKERESFRAMLGHHWEQAGDRNRARACYLAGARSAAKAYLHEEAEALYLGYLRLVDEITEETIEARNELGWDVWQVQGQTAKAREQHLQALEEARAIGARAAEAKSMRPLAWLELQTGKVKEAKKLFEQALAVAVELTDPRLEVAARGSLATLLREHGLMAEARELLGQAIAIAHELADRQQEATMIGNLAIVCMEQSQMEEARQLYERAIAIYREVGNRRSEGIALGNLAILHSSQGRIAEAQPLYGQAISLAREVGDRRSEGAWLGNLATLLLEQGQMEESGELLEQALAVSREVGDQRLTGVWIGSLANLHSSQGRMGTARRMYVEAISIARELGDRLSEGNTLGGFAALHLNQGRLEEARQLDLQALAIARELGNRRLEGQLLGSLAALARLAARDPAEADELAEAAKTASSDADDRKELTLLLVEQGHIALASAKEADHYLDQARKLANEADTGLKIKLARSLAMLERAIDAAAAGKPLFRGQCREDTPEAILRWIERHEGSEPVSGQGAD